MNSSNINTLYNSLIHDTNPKNVFADINDRKITYGELVKDTKKLFSLFEANGLKLGDRVILSTRDDYYTSLFFIAFLRYGIITVFLDPDVPQKRAMSIIHKTEAKGLVMDEALFSTRNISDNNLSFQLKIQKKEQKKGLLFKKLLGNKNSSSEALNNHFPAVLDNHSIELQSPLADVKPEDLAYILFTSGTTSFPKGVMITHQNVFTHLRTLTNVYALDKNVRILNLLMLYHVDGSVQGPLLSLYNQATWLRPFSFDLTRIEELFHAIYKYRATHFVAVPTILSFMDKFSEGFEDSFQTADFKFIISCASKLEKKLWFDFEEKFKTRLFNVYGLTETVTGSLFCGITPETGKIGTEGLPVDCEVKIITTKGTEAAINESGELYLRGAHIFSGYFMNEAATANVLNDNWLNTGDLAYKDNEGFYHVTGRSKNIIISGGINIYPEQITEMTNTHPAILECICLGLPDETFGEKLVCAYVLKPSQSLDQLSLITFLRPLLEQHQIPKEFYVFESLPKGLSGKIQLNETRELILSQSKIMHSDHQETYDMAIKEVASASFGVKIENISNSDTSNTLDGWDSMAHLFFITSLEKRFDVVFTTAEMLTMNSITATKNILLDKIQK